MSNILSQQNGVKARKRKRCCLCLEMIEVGQLKDVRSGVDCGDFWMMHMHPECHAYERKPGVVDYEWYEGGWEAAFERKDAIAFIKSTEQQQPVQRIK